MNIWEQLDEQLLREHVAINELHRNDLMLNSSAKKTSKEMNVWKHLKESRERVKHGGGSIVLCNCWAPGSNLLMQWAT